MCVSPSLDLAVHINESAFGLDTCRLFTFNFHPEHAEAINFDCPNKTCPAVGRKWKVISDLCKRFYCSTAAILKRDRKEDRIVTVYRSGSYQIVCFPALLCVRLARGLISVSHLSPSSPARSGPLL